MLRSRTLTVSIARPPGVVAAFVSDPPKLAQWLSFITEVYCADAKWFMATADGPMEIAFVPPNEFGVLDHRVRLADGQEFLNPMRVVANGADSEVLFTLFHSPGMSDERFEADAATVQLDLSKLKTVLERKL